MQNYTVILMVSHDKQQIYFFCMLPYTIALEVIKHIPSQNQEDRVVDLTEIKNYADNQVAELQLAQREVEEHQQDMAFHYRDSDYSAHHSNKTSNDICTIQ